MPLGTVPALLWLLKKTLAEINIVLVKLVKDALHKTLLTSHQWMKPSCM